MRGNHTVAFKKSKWLIYVSVLTIISHCSFFPKNVTAATNYGRIMVKQTSAGGIFVNGATGVKFTPRGNNYIRLAEQTDPFTGQSVMYHSNFDPERYSGSMSDAALLKMSQDGYNTVRVFINDIAVGNASGSGLSSTYMNNVADFLKRANNRQMRVMLTFVLLPRKGGYYTANMNPSQIEGANWHLLAPEAVVAKKKYLTDFVNALKSRSVPFNTIFSYNTENEIFYQEDQRPLSLSSGLVKVANGQTFDISSAVSRQQMMDAGLNYWINQVRLAVRAIDSKALVAPGFFSPLAVSGSDPRIIRTYWALADSTAGGSSADFIDLHIYPGFHTLQQEVQSFEVTSKKKPIVIGEYGAYKFVYPDIVQAAFALRDMQVATCKDYQFAGWLLWTWDSAEQSSSLWSAID